MQGLYMWHYGIFGFALSREWRVYSAYEKPRILSHGAKPDVIEGRSAAAEDVFQRSLFQRFSRPPGVCATVAAVPDVNRTGRRGA